MWYESGVAWSEDVISLNVKEPSRLHSQVKSPVFQVNNLSSVGAVEARGAGRRDGCLSWAQTVPLDFPMVIIPA